MNNYGKTSPGVLRGGVMYDTYKAKMHIKNNQIVGVESDAINGGELFGKEGQAVIEELGVGSIVQGIIEDKNYESIPRLIAELNIAYKNRLSKILLAKLPQQEELIQSQERKIQQLEEEIKQQKEIIQALQEGAKQVTIYSDSENNFQKDEQIAA